MIRRLFVRDLLRKEKKRKRENFMRGVLALMFSQVFIKLLGLVYRWYLTNKEGFGDDGNAIYGAGYNIYALLLTLSSIGVPNAVSKLISERVTLGDTKGAHRIFKVALATFAVIGMAGTLFLLLGAKGLAYAMGMPEAEMVLVVLSPSLFFVAICSVFRGFFNGQSRIKVTANSQTLEQVFKTVFTIVAVELVVALSGLNTPIMAAGATVATTLSTCLSFFYLYTYYKMHKKEKITDAVFEGKSPIAKKTVMQIVKAILWVSIPMSLSAILTSINRNIDSFTVVRLLQKNLPYLEARRQYGILSGKVELLTGLPLSFNVAFATALVPAIAAARASGNMKNGVKKITFSLLTTVVIVLPCVVGMVVFAEPILKLLFPNASDGAFIMQICVLATIFTAMEQTINGALQGLGKVFVPATALTIGVLLKLILNYILVPIPTDVFPLGGAVGAAFATDVCHFVAFWIVFKVLQKTIHKKISFVKLMFKPLLASGMMALVSYGTLILLKSIIAPKLATIIALMVAVIVYVLSILVLKVFSADDIKMLPFGQKIYAMLVHFRIYKEK